MSEIKFYREAPKGINQIGEKTATNIANKRLFGDSYHIAISKAARWLVDVGLGQLVYETQWGSGSTLWKCKEPFITVVVPWNDEIADLSIEVDMHPTALADIPWEVDPLP